jgi:hypothetical protein
MLPEVAMRKLKGVVSRKHKEDIKAFLRRHTLIRRLFASDLGILGRIHGTDKVWAHHYDRHYQAHFRRLRWNRLNLLEIGVGGDDNPDQGGNSLRMWKDYFPRANIYGIDVHNKSSLQELRIRIFQGSQADPEFLKRVANEIGSIDIIIDDGSHISEHVIISFQTLFPLLADDGIYAVEDLQTAYWLDYGGSTDPDCPTTSIAMCKRLIDGLNWIDIPGRQPSYFDQHIVAVNCYRKLILIKKGVNNRPNV